MKMNVKIILTYVYVFFVSCTAEQSAANVEFLDTLQRRQLTSSLEESTDFPTVGTEYSLSSDTAFTVFPISEASIQPEDSECLDVATDFAYSNNLCAGARDPVSYLSLATARYTCFDRCGKAPSYDDHFSQCGCDESCAAHRDCCRDMAGFCPDLHAIGKNIVYPYQLHKYTKCNDYVIIHSPKKAPSSFSSAPNPPATPSVGNRKKTLPFKPRTLAELTLPLKSYMVLDLSRKLLFENFSAFRLFSTANSTPHYIPKVSYLTCSMPHSEANRLPTALEILPWCKVTHIDNAMTPYYRPCKTHQLLICNCGDGRPLVEHVHNVCMGRNSSSFYRYTLWDMQVGYSLFSSMQEKICSIIKKSALGISNNLGNKQYASQYTMMMRVLPVLNISRPPPITHDLSIEAQKGTGEEQHLEISFTVELSNTLERRYHCWSHQSDLRDCRLEKCAAGVLLWTGDPSHDDHSVGHSCIKPVEARVFFLRSSQHIPTCICIRVLTTLNVFKLWKTFLTAKKRIACSVKLLPLRIKLETLEKMYTITDPDSMKAGGQSSPEGQNQVESKDLFIHLAKIKSFCPRERNHTFQVCFIVRETRNETKSDFCLTFGRESDTGEKLYPFMSHAYLLVAVLNLWWYFTNA